MGMRREYIKNAKQICIAKKHQPVMLFITGMMLKDFTMLLSYYY